MRAPAITGPFARFNTIGAEEIRAAADTIRTGPLSGYLGGSLDSGPRVEQLEHEFADAIGSKYAVAVNSATSGLLVACMAAGIGPGAKVLTTPFTMSATAAAPKFLGAEIRFGDIETDYFGLDTTILTSERAIIVTNLFGHPSELETWKRIASRGGVVLIEDNAQAPFAIENNKHSGTYGHMGVFSFNVHKHMQAGEGGIVVTDNVTLAHGLRLFRNHAELAGLSVALNLRMTEVTAAICSAQLRKRKRIISERIEIAETLTDAVKDIPGIIPPKVRKGCKHVYYCWALLIETDDIRIRNQFVEKITREGFPMSAGYVEPLYRLPAFKQNIRLLNIEHVDEQIAIYENCAWSPTSKQLKQVREAFLRAVDNLPIMG